MLKQDPQYVEEVLKLLKKYYPNAKIVLNFSNNWELLVAVMLSAQCTDVMVNKATSKLFPKYRALQLSYSSSEGAVATESRSNSSRQARTINKELQEIINFAEADIKELEQDIRSTGFYRNKAKNIKAAARLLLDKFNGQVPKTMEELLTLPGVARKTANIVLGNAYGVVEGMAVDTHVYRLSHRLGFSDSNNPDKVEKDLMRVIPKKEWFPLTYLLIEHGRAICKAPLPRCDQCFLNKLCPSAFNFPNFKSK